MITRGSARVRESSLQLPEFGGHLEREPANLRAHKSNSYLSSDIEGND